MPNKHNDKIRHKFCKARYQAENWRAYDAALRDRGSLSPEARLEAAELLRTLVERIVLTPEAGTLAITLRGDLAGILALAEHKTKSHVTIE